MKSVKISEDIHVLIGGEFPYCNSIVFLNPELTIIDPGCQFESIRLFLRKSGKEPRDIKNVILSHIHPDHIAHAAKIQRLSSCNLMANSITAPLFDDKEMMREFLGFTKGHPVRSHWEKLVNERMYGALDDGKISTVLEDSECFQIGDYGLKMIMTPGHTPDHMCIELVDQALLYTADIDCTEFGPYYGHPNSSIPDFGESVRKILNSNVFGIISGHLEDPVLYEFQDEIMRYWNKVLARENLVYEAIKNGAKTVFDITQNPIIYPSLSNLVYLQFETWMVEHHLKSLHKRGLISETRDGYSTV